MNQQISKEATYSKLNSIFQLKCPRCRQGDLFTHKPYQLAKFLAMPKKCECCHQQFELEPSFYYGAMYVSYAFQVAIFVIIFVALQIFYPEAGTWVYIIGVIGVILILFPLILRLSRSIWIHFFVKFNPEYARCTKQSERR